jgi:hypothetical protein
MEGVILKYALVGEAPEGGFGARHFIGLPPSIDSEGFGSEELPPARVAVIARRSDGYFLFRFDPAGEEVGDTWYRTEEEALLQAQNEFGSAIERWIEVPDAEPGELGNFVTQLLGSDDQG